MSTPNDRDPAAQEPDPTGMRALLASLPDPGPMPAEVTARITAALHREQQHRLHHPGQEGMPSAGPEHTQRGATQTSQVSSLESRRRTRVPHLLAAVASVAAVGLAGVVVLDQVAGDGSLGDLAAVYWNGNDAASSAQGQGSGDGGSQEAGGDSAVEGEAMQDSGQEAGQAESAPDSVAGAAPEESATRTEQLGPGFEPGEVRVIAVTRPLTRDAFALGVSIALDTADRAGAAHVESELSAPAATSCLRTTGESPAGHEWIVSAIALDDDDAVLVVASGTPERAWALTPDCALGTEGSQIMLGPVEVP